MRRTGGAGTVMLDREGLVKCCEADQQVTAYAREAVRPALVLTSDGDDMSELCGKAVRVVPV